MFFKRSEQNETLRCSFCSKTQEQVDTLISNPADHRVFICNECVAVCHSVLEDHRKGKSATVESRLKASVWDEHRRANADTLANRLNALSGRP